MYGVGMSKKRELAEAYHAEIVKAEIGALLKDIEEYRAALGELCRIEGEYRDFVKSVKYMEGHVSFKCFTDFRELLTTRMSKTRNRLCELRGE